MVTAFPHKMPCKSVDEILKFTNTEPRAVMGQSVQQLGYGLCDRRSMVQFPARGGGWEFFSSPPRPERLWGPLSLLFNAYRLFFSPGVKRPGREADHSPPSSDEVKNEWSYTTPPIRLHGMVLS
jgi:hypothetical protein